MNQPIICIHEAILRNEAFEEDISLLTSVIGGYLSQPPSIERFNQVVYGREEGV